MSANREARYQSVADEVLPGLSGEASATGLEQVRFLVDGWYDGAGDIDPDDLFRIGLSDLKEAVAGVPQSRIVEKLSALVLERKVDMLSAHTFQLARHVVDRAMTAQAAQADAAAILREVDALLPSVHRVQDVALQQRLLQELADADLECRYIIEGETGATSIRLNHYMRSQSSQKAQS